MSRPSPDDTMFFRPRDWTALGLALILVVIWLAVALTARSQPAGGDTPFSWGSEQERIRGWEADLDTVLTVYLPKDRSFDPETRARVTAEIQTLRNPFTN